MCSQPAAAINISGAASRQRDQTEGLKKQVSQSKSSQATTVLGELSFFYWLQIIYDGCQVGSHHKMWLSEVSGDVRISAFISYLCDFREKHESVNLAVSTTRQIKDPM